MYYALPSNIIVVSWENNGKVFLNIQVRQIEFCKRKQLKTIIKTNHTYNCNTILIVFCSYKLPPRSLKKLTQHNTTQNLFLNENTLFFCFVKRRIYSINLFNNDCLRDKNYELSQFVFEVTIAAWKAATWSRTWIGTIYWPVLKLKKL